MGAWGESKKEDAGARIAKARDRTCPVLLVDVGTTAGLPGGDAEGSQPRTALAEDDRLPYVFELSLADGNGHDFLMIRSKRGVRRSMRWLQTRRIQAGSLRGRHWKIRG